jgi:hypothetical protein
MCSYASIINKLRVFSFEILRSYVIKSRPWKALPLLILAWVFTLTGTAIAGSALDSDPKITVRATLAGLLFAECMAVKDGERRYGTPRGHPNASLFHEI